MRTGRGQVCLAVAAVMLAIGTDGASAEPVEAAVITKDQIEADWLRQEQVRHLPAQGGGVRPEEDAAGGCDGVKDGRWGFHTNLADNPWWQVDLGKVFALHQILIYNRCDGASDRALRLEVLLSDDGKQWRPLYRHDGTMFRGAPDNKPLSISAAGAKARYVRIQVPGQTFLHLDEVEVFPAGNNRNIALGKPATQIGTSQWSSRQAAAAAAQPTDFPVVQTVERGLRLAESLRPLGVAVEPSIRKLQDVAAAYRALDKTATTDAQRSLYFDARWTIRKLAFANPLLNFDSLLFVKRVPTSFTHMSDQNYGWFSRPGGALYVLENFKGPEAKLRCLTPQLPAGNFLQPELSYDGDRILFAYCRYYPGLAELQDKLDKSRIPEDAFYHLFEMKRDGSGLRRLTHGKYDDFDGRYLPNGEIVFLSTRRGQDVQCGQQSATATFVTPELPDSYVRCGGGSERPVAVYTLHVMDAEAKTLRTISPFENFEWHPTVANDGRIVYARWDYVDRDNMPYMSLWSTLPDGTGAQAVFGNYTISPYAMFEARSIPHSHKFIFTASAHHAITGGSLVLLDPSKGADGPGPMTRLTPEVPFPEVEGWPASYFVNPYPLSEQHYLVAWSDRPLAEGWPKINPPNALGLYLYDAFGNLELIHRDPRITSMYPTPIAPRPKPPALASPVDWSAEDGRMLLVDVYQGLAGIERGSIERLRLVGVPAKTQPTMNSPALGITRDDPGKFVLGTVPVEPDGSAYFHVPAGVGFFLQALDADGMAVQTMRSVTYVQPGQTYTCVGCHEQRNTAPLNHLPLASRRDPSRITPGPQGSWPLDYSVLVQPVLEKHCVACHRPGAEAPTTSLVAAKSYDTLITTGGPGSLRQHVLTRYRQGRSTAGAGAARTSVLLEVLKRGHYNVELSREDRDRLITWMDTYAQRAGSFGPDQEERLRQLRRRMAELLVAAPPQSK